MRIIAGIIFIFSYFQLSAQGILNDLKRRAIEKVKAKATNSVSKELEKTRAAFDSTDFDYAILLSDNSGLFNVKEKGEFKGKFLTLGNLGSSFYKDIDFTDAENARFNLEMGEAAYAMGRFVFAEKRFKNAQSIYEKSNLTDDLGYLKAIANRGLLYTTMGRFNQATKYTDEALNLRKTKFGMTNMGIAASLNNYGVLHYSLGDYNESEKEFAVAVSVIQSSKLQSAMPYAIVLNNEAMLFQSIGRYEEAVKVLQEAIAVAGQLENTRSKNHLKFLSNLALLYQQMNKYDEAEKIYRDMEKRLDKNKPEYANMLNNLAVLYLAMNKEEKIADILKQSASIYESSFGDESPAYAKVTSDLGNFYRYKGNYTEAEPLLEKALTIREQTLGKNHPLYVQSQEDLGILFWKTKSWDKAYSIYREVMEKSLDFINRYFTPMSEAEKTKYWDILSPRFQRFYNFAIEASAINKEVISEMLVYQMATKGLLLNSARKITQTILTGGNEELIKDYTAWIDQKEELTRLYAYSKADLKEQNINIDSLESATNAIEKKLSENSKEFARFYFTSVTSITEIQNQLKENEAMLEIIRVRNYDQNFVKGAKYAALIVAKGTQQPQLIILDNGNELETQYLKAYRSAIRLKKNDDQSYNQYWLPIESGLKGKKKIYVSLDGVFNQINLYTLKKPAADFLISQYDIVLLGNAKDIITIDNKTNKNAKKSATLIGYPDYGSDRLPALPGSKTEVEEISKILKTSGYQVVQFTQKNATETNLKNTKGSLILHIATHGYFFPDVEKIYLPIGISTDNAKENVLLRSGLMMAGATEKDNLIPNLDNMDNGIITSYEAMNLDLQGTNLVVLSACETGLGEIKAGEGVYGLQRAFLAAGADALIMSLWKVDDVATQQLMTSFYANWIKTGDKQKAFKQAQLQLITKYKDPYYWGAFVMMGN